MLVAKLIAISMMVRSRSNHSRRSRRANEQRRRMSNSTDQEHCDNNERVRVKTSLKRAEEFPDPREERRQALPAKVKRRRRRAVLSSQQRQTEIDQSFFDSNADISESERTMSPESQHIRQVDPEQVTLIKLTHQPTRSVISEPLDESEQKDPLLEHFDFANELQELRKENDLLKNVITILKHKQKSLQSDLARVTEERDNLRNVLTFDIKNEETI